MIRPRRSVLFMPGSNARAIDKARNLSADGVILDRAVVERLRQAGGSDLVRELLELFREEARTRLEAMQSGLSEGDGEKIRQAAHSLKGAAASLGARAVEKACTDLEQKGQAGTVAECGPVLTRLQSEFQQTCSALEQFL